MIASQAGNPAWTMSHAAIIEQNVPVQAVSASIEGVMDRGQPVRSELTLFNTVRLQFHLEGVTEEQGTRLIDTFKRR